MLLVAAVEVAEDMWVKRQQQQSVSAYEPGNKSHHEKLDNVLIIRLSKLLEQLLAKDLRVVEQIDGHEVGQNADLVFTLLLTLLLLNDLQEVLLTALCKLGALVVFYQQIGVLFGGALFIF